MKICLFGDIHSNIEALDAVLADAKAQGIANHICLGDIVGYGASPKSCVRRIMDLGCPTVAGNHDFAVIGYTSDDYFNPFARDAVNWTRKQLSKEETDFLASLPYVHEDLNGFTVVHSTLDEPEKWGYVLNFFDAARCFQHQKTQVCFIGHSHLPMILEHKETIEAFYDLKVRFDQGCRYIVNIGSVGQPRDGNNRASYAIYDTEKKAVELRRVSYDIESAQMKIINAGLPEVLADRLGIGK